MKMLIFSGPPGSGKTTLSKEIAAKQNMLRFSFDEEHCLQHKELVPLVVEALCNGRSVVVDAVYAERQHRIDLLSAVTDIPCQKILIFMATPIDECVRRNAQRINSLPEFMVRDIYNSFEPPNFDEGWDEIRKVRPYEVNLTSN